MKRWIHASQDNSILNRIPKKYKNHIEDVEVSLSDDFNNRGQQLRNYTVIYDNGDEITFQNLEYMLKALKENTDENGYYIGV